MKNYKRRIIAYFDILGFKNMINRSIEINKIESIISILETLKTISTPSRPTIIKNSDYEVKRFFSMFSDNIIITFDIDLESEVSHTVSDIFNIIISLVSKKVLVRGSIICGDIYHDENYVFGPGLVKAYELEQYAIYPRVLVDNEVLEIAKKYPFFANSSDLEGLLIDYMLCTDLDGLKYIDYFNLAEDSFENTGLNMDLYYSSLRETICEIYPIAKKDTSLFMKYKWLENKYNNGINHINKCYKSNYCEIHS
jgi:hypothetical protein